MTIHVQSSESTPLPTPISIADFKNGVYSLHGAPKVLADLFTLSIFTGDDTNIAVITGEGFKCEYEGTASASGQLAATPALFTALTPAAGFTAVIDVSSTVGAAADVLGDIELELLDSNTGHAGRLMVLGGLGTAPNTGLNIGTTSEGAPLFTNLAAYSNGSHRLVISYDPANLIGAADGGSVVTAAAFADQATADHVTIYLEAIKSANLVVERVRFYPLMVDPSILRDSPT